MYKPQLFLVSILVFTQQLQAGVVESVLGTASCALASELLVSQQMVSEPLYRGTPGACQAVRPTADGSYFSDSGCENPVTFRSSSIADYCNESLDPDFFGNGERTVENVWWQQPALRLNIGVESLVGNSVPYETRRVYKEVASDRGNGTCKLEMRVYKKSIEGKSLKPLLMIHGGSWNARQGGMVGLQSQISHYTDDGFVVFTPFYRLTKENEANTECNNVGGEAIVEDANDALDWVADNAAEFGGIVSDDGILVAGQSAGGHLAASLAVHQSDKVARALLLYPPVDFPHVIGDWKANGIGENTLGVAAVESFIGSKINDADLNSAIITENNFPAAVAANSGNTPPIFMIHGDADGLVPVSQSARLCNSLGSGDAENGAADDISIPDGGGRKVIDCGTNDSQLHVIAGADHILDVCILTGVPFLDDICPTGPASSQDAARSSLAEARAWLTKGASAVADPSDSGSGEREPPDESVESDNGNSNRGSSGGGSVGWLFLLTFLLIKKSRLPRTC